MLELARRDAVRLSVRMVHRELIRKIRIAAKMLLELANLASHVFNMLAKLSQSRAC